MAKHIPTFASVPARVLVEQLREERTYAACWHADRDPELAEDYRPTHARGDKLSTWAPVICLRLKHEREHAATLAA